jgi:DNA-binding NarL/FixJ family response regulator
VRLIAVDDHLLVREGLVTLMRAAGHDVVASTSDPAAVPSLVRAHAPDVVLVDIKMPPTFTDEGLRLAGAVRRHHPEVGVLVLSQYLVASYATALLEQSPERVGYLLKDNVLRADVLEGAIQQVAAGGTFVDPGLVAAMVEAAVPPGGLTERELEVLGLMAEGLSDRGIADRLTVGISTVYTHVQHVFTKLDLPATSSDNRRVRAVVAYLATRPSG